MKYAAANFGFEKGRDTKSCSLQGAKKEFEKDFTFSSCDNFSSSLNEPPLVRNNVSPALEGDSLKLR